MKVLYFLWRDGVHYDTWVGEMDCTNILGYLMRGIRLQKVEYK